MITFNQISINELLPYIEVAFMYDEKLSGEYHISPSGDYKKCALHTFDKIVDGVKEFKKGIDIYGIELVPPIFSKTKVEPKSFTTKIGFVILEEKNNLLYSFGITKEFRTETVKKLFMDFVTSHLKGNGTTYLYARNTRAINFLKRNGFKETTQLFEGEEKIIRLTLTPQTQNSN